MFDGILERNCLNYQPITDRMTQCASELNQIKSFIFKTIVVYISTCTLSYSFVCFLDVVLLVTCRKFTSKQIMLKNKRNDIKWQFPVSLLNCFTLEKYMASERLSIYVALYVFWGWLSHLSLFQGKISEVKQRNIVPMVAL